MSHLCSLSVNSLYCLASTPNDVHVDSLSLKRAKTDAPRGGQAAPNEKYISAERSCASYGSSGNMDFMINLMNMCNKMILPLAALQHECDRLDKLETVSTPEIQQSQQQREAPSLKQEKQQQNQFVGQQTNNQFKQPTPESWPSNNSKRQKNACNAVKKTSGQHLNAEQKTASTPHSQLSARLKTPPLCIDEAAAAAAAAGESGPKAQRPLLSDYHGVPFWSLARYHDFRAVAPDAPTQLVEPMIDDKRHREMIIMDCHRRLKVAFPKFSSTEYRPY